MTATDAAGTDKGVGLSLLFGGFAVLAAIVMAVTGLVATRSLRGTLEIPEALTSAMEFNAAVGFALAMTFALLAVVAVQWYDG